MSPQSTAAEKMCICSTQTPATTEALVSIATTPGTPAAVTPVSNLPLVGIIVLVQHLAIKSIANRPVQHAAPRCLLRFPLVLVDPHPRVPSLPRPPSHPSRPLRWNGVADPLLPRPRHVVGFSRGLTVLVAPLYFLIWPPRCLKYFTTEYFSV